MSATAYLGETPLLDIAPGCRLVKGHPDQQVLLELGREFAPELLVRLGSNDERIRRWAIDIINQLPPGAVSDSLAKILVKQMKDPDPATADDAAQLLTHLGDNAVPGLIEGAGSKDDTIQWVCINALADRTTAKSSPAAIAVLRNALSSPRWPIRFLALEWVERLEAPPDGVVEILARGLTPNQPDSFNRAFALETAVTALGRFAVKPKISVPAIIGALDSDDQVQTLNAIRALRAFGPDASSAVPKLITLLEKYPDIASETTATLAALSPKGRKAAAAYYVNLLANAPNADIRMEAVRALDPLADEAGDAVPILGKLLAGDDNMLRIEVARTLSQIGPGAASTKPALIRMVDNHDPEIRAAAADALVKIAPDGAGLSPALMAAVYNGDRSATNRLAATIQRAGNTEALIRKLNDVASDDPEPAVRAAARHAVEFLTLDAGPATATRPGK
jgi:HEAT repeat protein